MKSQIRVHRNGGSKPASAQAGNRSQSQAKTPRAVTVRVTFHDPVGGEIAGQIKISRARFAKVLAGAKECGGTLPATMRGHIPGWLEAICDQADLAAKRDAGAALAAAPAPAKIRREVTARLVFHDPVGGEVAGQIKISAPRFAKVQAGVKEIGGTFPGVLRENLSGLVEAICSQADLAAQREADEAAAAAADETSSATTNGEVGIMELPGGPSIAQAVQITPSRESCWDGEHPDLEPEARRVGEVLGMTEPQIKALALLAEWEGQTPAEFCRMAAVASLESSWDDLSLFAEHGGKRPGEKAWALEFFPRVQPLMGQGGQ